MIVILLLYNHALFLFEAIVCTLSSLLTAGRWSSCRLVRWPTT